MREPGPDLYRVLGVSRDATAADITRAYRRQALSAHPDTAPPGTGAAARFRAVSEAYQVLGDPARRTGYDRARWPRQAPGHGHGTPGAPLAWTRVQPGAGAARTPALWAGPVRVEPLPAAAAAPDPGSRAGRQAAVAAPASPVRWYLSTASLGVLW